MTSSSNNKNIACWLIAVVTFLVLWSSWVLRGGAAFLSPSEQQGKLLKSGCENATLRLNETNKDLIGAPFIPKRVVMSCPPPPAGVLRQQLLAEKYTSRVASARTAISLGPNLKPRVGSNNMLMSVLHALDMAEERNETTVISLGGWALHFWMDFLGLQKQSWNSSLMMTTAPVVLFGELRKRRIAREAHLHNELFARRDLIMFEDAAKARQEMEIYKRRRIEMFTAIFSLFLSPGRCSIVTDALYNHPVWKQAAPRTQREKFYVSIHVRSLEGSCIRRLGSNVPIDECQMSPSYVKEILRPLGCLGTVPIVVISDMQNNATIHSLKKDPELGPWIIVPTWDLQSNNNQTEGHELVWQDMVLAAMADVFIGVRVSSMSVIIGQMRAALGFDLSTNYIYTHSEKIGFPTNESRQLRWSVCGECIFLCDEAIYSRCGRRKILA